MIDHLHDYLTMLRGEINVSPKTVEAYESDVRRYLSYINEIEGLNTLHDINQKHLRGYVRLLSDILLAPSSISRMIASVRSYHQFLSREKILKENPSLSIKTPKQKKSLPTVLSKEEIEKLRKNLDLQLVNLQAFVSKLANKLQRLLLAKQNRSWEFDLEEGMLDASKLSRVIILSLIHI